MMQLIVGRQRCSSLEVHLLDDCTVQQCHRLVSRREGGWVLRVLQIITLSATWSRRRCRRRTTRSRWRRTKDNKQPSITWLAGARAGCSTTLPSSCCPQPDAPLLCRAAVVPSRHHIRHAQPLRPQLHQPAHIWFSGIKAWWEWWCWLLLLL